MLHARGQSTAEIKQQHVDRLHRHTIHTTSAGMAHANGPTARATVNSTSWWWGQEQRVVLNFVDADTTQKATGATSAQIDFVCVICTSNSSTAAVASLSLPLSLCVSLFTGTSQRYRHLSTCPFIFSQLQRSQVFVQTAFIPYYRQRHLLRTAYFARGWRLIDRPKPSTCSYLPCSYLTIRLPPRCSGCLFLFQYSMSTCPIMLCSTVCCAVQQ